MGQSMAELFAEEGAAVVITARHQEKLDAVVDGIRARWKGCWRGSRRLLHRGYQAGV